MRNREEEIGKIYGCYKILEFCNNQTCICECQKCGNVRSVDFYHLKDRNYEYCDKCVRPRKLKYDLVGKKFGKLTIIDYAENKVQPNVSTKIQYKCLCDCGNECIVQSNHLISGHTTSCGCEQRIRAAQCKYKDIVGVRYGKLTAIERVYENGKSKWRCICDCGNEKIVDIRNLNSGHTTSCGCITSVAENDMCDILKKKRYNFIQQYRFDDCKDKRRLPFDFAILENDRIKFLIEIQGQQHYHPFTFNGEPKEVQSKNYDDRVKKDRIKSDYCREHNIPLLEIKYTRFDKMEQILDDFVKNL